MNKIDIIFILLTVHHLFYISSLDISNIVFLFIQCRYDFYSSFHLVPQRDSFDSLCFRIQRVLFSL